MAQNSQGGVHPVAIGIAGLVGITLLILAAPLLILGLGIWGAISLNRKSQPRQAIGVMLASILLAGAASVGVYALLSDSEEPARAEPADSNDFEIEPVRAQPTRTVSTFTVPALLGDNLETAMDQNSDIRFAWHDLAPSLIPSEAGEGGRAVLLPDNWRIVAQCDKGRTLPEDADVTVGVVKDAEVNQLDATTILNGGYNLLLGCR